MSQDSLTRTRLLTLRQKGLEWLHDDESDAVEERILADVSTLAQAQSAALWVLDDGKNLYVAAHRGLFDVNAYEARWPTDATLLQHMREGKPWVTGEAPHMHAWVPLLEKNAVLGLIQLSDSLVGEFRAETLEEMLELADFAAAAWKAARRLKTLKRQGLKDRETGAYHLAYFTDYASKEIYKARRYGRTFTLLSFSIENLPQVRQRLGADTAARATRGVTRALSRIIRDPDVLARSNEQAFFLLMPETDFFGSAMFLRRAASSIRFDTDLRDIEETLPLGVIGGAATYPKDGEDFDELVQSCQKRLTERRASLQVKMQLEPIPFWDEIELLAGTRRSPPLPSEEASPPSVRAPVTPKAFEQIQLELTKELGRDPHTRGLLYVSCPEIHKELPVLQGLEALSQETLTRTYVLGPLGNIEFHPQATIVFLENDARSRRHPFVLWLSEHASFAWVQGSDEEATWAFQTTDAAVVESLVAKLQSEYDLQPY